MPHIAIDPVPTDTRVAATLLGRGEVAVELMSAGIRFRITSDETGETFLRVWNPILRLREMRHTNGNTEADQRRQLGYDAAQRVSADGNTVRVVYERVLRPSAHTGLIVRRNIKQLAHDEDLPAFADVLQV